MVSLSGLTYEFEVWPKNMIAPFSKIEIVFPVGGWKLNCASPSTLPTVVCKDLSC